MATLKDREANFAEAFNKTIHGIVNKSTPTSQPEQYYQNLDIAQVIELKETLNSVNNIITLKAAQAFVWKLDIDSKVKEDIDTEINKQSGNENGYDIKCNGDFKFIAEVKCNIPARSTKEGFCFDSRQLESIPRYSSATQQVQRHTLKSLTTIIMHLLLSTKVVTSQVLLLV